MKMIDAIKFIVVSLLIVLLAGCGTMSTGRGWGEDVSIPTWERLKISAVKAARDPETWVPLAGVLVVSVGDLDTKISDWASRETPIFGSQNTATNTSNELRDALEVSFAVTALVTPSGDNAEDWLTSKFKALLVQGSAAHLVSEATTILKEGTNRTRPNGVDNYSFPSGHSSQSHMLSTLASRNVNALRFSSKAKRAMRISFKSLAAGTAWARVEAKAHYPSDVLAGAALANFFSSFIHDAFMGLEEDTYVGLMYDREATRLHFSARF